MVTKADTRDVAEQIAELRADLEKLTATIADLAQNRAEGLVEQLQKKVAELSANAESMVKSRVAGAEATLDEFSAHVRQKPLHMLALALGAGMVFGILFGRR